MKLLREKKAFPTFQHFGVHNRQLEKNINATLY